MNLTKVIDQSGFLRPARKSSALDAQDSQETWQEIPPKLAAHFFGITTGYEPRAASTKSEKQNPSADSEKLYKAFLRNFALSGM